PRGVVLEGGRFRLPGCDPGKTYRVFLLDAVSEPISLRSVVDDGRQFFLWGLGGDLQARFGALAEISAAKAEGGELTLRRQPCGSARVRLRDAAGKPSRVIPWVELEVVPDRGKREGERAALAPSGLPVSGKTPMTPDAEGRLTVRGLIPGATYRLKAYDLRA